MTEICPNCQKDMRNKVLFNDEWLCEACGVRKIKERNEKYQDTLRSGKK